MKLKYLPLFIGIALIGIGCAEETPTNSHQGNNENLISNKTRDSNKNIKSISEYSLFGNDTAQGVLSQEEKFDENGNIIQKIRYEVNETESKIVYIDDYEYDEAGNLTKQICKTDDSESITNYTYDNKGNKLSTLFFVPGEKDMKTEYLYENGLLIEEKVYIENVLEYSDKVQYEYDNQNRISEKSIIRTYSGGNSDEVFHTVYTYNELNQVIEEKQLRVNDSSCCARHLSFQYDKAGNVSEIKEFEDEEFIHMTRFTYNEFGELLIDSIFYGHEGYWRQLSHYLDDYGNKVRSLKLNDYSNSKGYRYEITYH